MRDQAVDSCRRQIAASRPAARLACNAASADHWLCPAGIAVRLAALDECDAMSRGAHDQAAMLYLMGLGFVDVPYLADSHRDCQRFYRFQEGSNVCVYENAHFDRVMARHPNSPWAGMAAYRVAETGYRYYECEGSVTCAAENAIAGFIDFLDQRPRSRYASLATDRVVAGLGVLRDPVYANGRSDNEAGRLPEDLRRLASIARKLSAANRTKLSASVTQAQKAVDVIERDRHTGLTK